ncbi:MAG: hypothetical protein ACLSUW_05285 [Akkermansia sp.]
MNRPLPPFRINHLYRCITDMDSKITRLIEQASVIVGALPTSRPTGTKHSSSIRRQRHG